MTASFHKVISRIGGFATVLLLCSTIVHAQESIEHTSPFAHGAGRTYAITSRGLDAVGLNPSLLALGTPRTWELSIVPISSFGINAGPSFSQINAIASGFTDSALASQVLTADSITRGDSVRISLANLLGGNKLSSTADLRIFGLSYYNPNFGTLALTGSLHAAVRSDIPDAFLNYVSLGFISRLIQGFHLPTQQVDLQAIWYGDYSLSYAKCLVGENGSGDLQLLGGAALKYLMGIGYLRMDPNSTFAINDMNGQQYQPNGGARFSVNYKITSSYPDIFNPNHLPNGFSSDLLVNASAGSGIGGDIGFTLGFYDSVQHSPWQCAISVTDIGSITWNKNTYVRSADTSINVGFGSLGSRDTVNSKLQTLGGKLDTNAAAFSSSLPTTLHIAGAIDFSQIGLSIAGSDVEAAAEYALGLTDVVGSPNHGRLGIAVILDHPSSAFSYHTALGFTTQDGTSDLTLAAGLGIANIVQFDVGTAGLTSLFKSDSHSDVVFGLKILF